MTAHSPALLAFGADSFVELLSATVVLLVIIPSFPLTKERAAWLTGILLIGEKHALLFQITSNGFSKRN